MRRVVLIDDQPGYSSETDEDLGDVRVVGSEQAGDFYVPTFVECETCEGSGRLAANACWRCGGSGRAVDPIDVAVDGFRDDETLKERNQRLRRELAGEREQARFKPGADDREQRRLVPELRSGLAEDVGPDRLDRRVALGSVFASGGQVRRPGRPKVQVDHAVLVAEIERLAATAGLTVADLARPAAPGRPSQAERERLDQLALVIVELRRSFPVAAIADALERPVSQVHTLERRGFELATAKPEKNLLPKE